MDISEEQTLICHGKDWILVICGKKVLWKEKDLKFIKIIIYMGFMDMTGKIED